MAAESLLYRAIFTLFLGFIIFVSSILNKTFTVFEAINQYYVLFIFTGFIISIIGIVSALTWHFQTRLPFYEPQPKRITKVQHFTPYLAFGILLILLGFFSIYYVKIPNKNIYIMTMSISITGILLLLNGLRYFIKEAIIGKTPRHS